MPLIHPPETVLVDFGQLSTVVAEVRRARDFDDVVFRREISEAVSGLRESLIIPRILEQHTIKVYAEEVWWAVQAADELGHNRDYSPIGMFFSAVDDLGVALIRQAPRTDRAMVAVIEAEALIEATHLDPG